MVGVLLVAAFLSVKSTRNQIIACFILVSISEVFFSSVVPAFFNGCIASLLSISTYLSTLGMIPLVIREKDPRYINLPMVSVSVVNAMIWTTYAVLKKDIPLFMTNIIAFLVMSTNLTFYMWTLDMVPTNFIQLLITFFQMAFPDDSDAMQADEEAAVCERRLDAENDDDQCSKQKQDQMLIIN